MFRLSTKDGVDLGFTEEINYIRINKNGLFTTCKQEDAIGVAFRGKAYNLLNHKDIKDAETIIISKSDIGSVIETVNSTLEKIRVLCDEQKRIIAEHDEAIITLYEILTKEKQS